jgi:hypothetical protein
LGPLSVQKPRHRSHTKHLPSNVPARCVSKSLDAPPIEAVPKFILQLEEETALGTTNMLPISLNEPPLEEALHMLPSMISICAVGTPRQVASQREISSHRITKLEAKPPKHKK